MEPLGYKDLNSMNAIVGYLRCIKEDRAADVLCVIQAKAMVLLEQYNTKETNK